MVTLAVVIGVEDVVLAVVIFYVQDARVALLSILAAKDVTARVRKPFIALA